MKRLRVPRLFVLGACLLGACTCRSAATVGPGAEAPVEASPAEARIGSPPAPGVTMVDDALEARLRETLAALGPDYVPRTEHLRPDGSPEFVNRLLLEPSPYLLQHAHNPVSWFPWGEEAFAKARAEGKPVLLSVGYATCHWCHVMERESFEDREIAEVINAHFVPVKVDREVRPDVDEIYMTAVQLMTGRGGWPMTVVMTPEGEPFFAGTYFPARDGDRGARRGFLSILHMLREAYRERRDDVVAQAQELSQRVRALTAPARPSAVPGPEALSAATQAIARRFDAEHGGWGRAPKFPQPSRLVLVLRVARRLAPSAPERAAALREQALVTLERMAAGGMHDQVGGGFHRYSTDPRWLVPHFEKMLYDNAQLALAYLEGAQATRGARREALRDVARRTLDYALREMRAPGGGFYSATDADSPTPSGESEEGWFFTWTPAELGAALAAMEPDAVARLARFWDVTAGGNFEGRSILHETARAEAFARAEGLAPERFRAELEAARESLYAVRATRPPPGLDDKVLADWNG
ncbi:MAG: thioredoxin domain-containing protein, partial [Myxococcota bacterium]